MENLHAVLTSWHSNLGRSLRGQPFLFLSPVSHRSIYSILMHSIAFFLCISWFRTFFYDFFFLKTVPALMCLCRVSRFDIKRSFLLPPCLVYFWVGPQLLDCCSNNARFRAQLQVRLPTTAHKEKQYHNMLETGHAFRGWYSVVVRILHGCEDRMMLPRIGGFLI